MPQTVTGSVTGKSVTGLTVTLQAIPDIIIGVPFNYQIQATVGGGTPPYETINFFVPDPVNFPLPNGITLTPTGLLSGTATNAATYKVGATVTDSGN